MVRKGNLVVFEGSSISKTGETTPTKIGVYVYILYIYIYSNFGIRDDNIQLWIHIGLLAICLILAIINVIVQFIKTIPYGRHDKGDSNFPRIPARISFAISQFIPGTLVLSV